MKLHLACFIIHPVPFNRLRVVDSVKWKPAHAFFGKFLFGGFLLEAFFQVVDSSIPYYFLLMVSYILTLVPVAIARGARPPSALGVPYTRESG